MAESKFTNGKGFHKKIVPLAVWITLMALIVTGCSNQLLPSIQKPTANSQETLSQPAGQMQSNINQSNPGSVSNHPASESATKPTSTKLNNDLKTYLKETSGKKSWYPYIKTITSDSKEVVVKTSLTHDKQIANTIAGAIINWPKFSGTVIIESSSGAILSKESKVSKIQD